MYQSQQNNRLSQGEHTDSGLSHKIDILCLAILFVGFFSCLIRSDYNFAVIFFCYFVWQQRKDSLALKIILASLVVLIVFDILFAIIEIRVWVQDDNQNPVWQTLRPMHNFGIFCYTIIMILKIILLFFVAKGVNKQGKSVESNQHY